jgi:RsiW-degrading membrane proteinase PrsW (M82 family)
MFTSIGPITATILGIFLAWIFKSAFLDRFFSSNEKLSGVIYGVITAIASGILLLISYLEHKPLSFRWLIVAVIIGASYGLFHEIRFMGGFKPRMTFGERFFSKRDLRN